MGAPQLKTGAAALALAVPVTTYIIYFVKGLWQTAFWEAAQDFAYAGVEQSVLWIVTAGLAALAGYLGMTSKLARQAEKQAKAAASAVASVLAAVVPILSLAQALAA